MRSNILDHVKNVKWAALFVCILIVSGIMVACGGGGGGGGGSLAGGGISGTGRSTGTITAFGSVFVNGIEYESNKAAITVDEIDATENDLKIGMKVTIEAVNNVARSITFDPEIKGPVSSIGASSFNILGQTVTVNSETVFCLEDEHDDCSFSFADLEEDDYVVVSGFFDSNGDLVATLVAKEDNDPGEYQVKGTIESLDTNSKTLVIKGLTVRYGGISSPPSLSIGVFIEVEGTLNAQNEIMASEIEIEGNDEEHGDELDVEGLITEKTSSTEFVVNRLRVRTNSQTRFRNGTASDLAVNIRVKVEGSVDNNGKLIASEVKFEDYDIDD